MTNDQYRKSLKHCFAKYHYLSNGAKNNMLKLFDAAIAKKKDAKAVCLSLIDTYGNFDPETELSLAASQLSYGTPKEIQSVDVAPLPAQKYKLSQLDFVYTP